MPYVLLAAGVGVCILSGIRVRQISDSQKAQIAGELWAGESGIRYRQISCFAKGQPQGNGSPDLYLSSAVSLNKEDIANIRTNIDAVVRAASEKNSGKSGSSSDDTGSGEDTRLWIDAYSAEADCTVIREATDLKAADSAQVTLTGVSGDYYLIHPLQVLHGAFLSDDSLDTQKIVLDKELAFKLFGSYDIVGSHVTINQRSYTVIGVVEHGGTKIDRKTSGDLLHAYVPFDELVYLSSGSAASSDLAAIGDTSGTADLAKDTAGGTGDAGNAGDSSVLAVSCYEVVLPNRIEGIAMQNLVSAMETAGKSEKYYLFVDNTDRFSFLRLYDTLFPIGDTAAERMQYKLPFWELSAETAESVSIFWWVLFLAGAGTVITSLLAVYAAFGKRKAEGQ